MSSDSKHKATIASSLQTPEFSKILLEDSLSAMERALRTALADRHDIFVSELVKKLKACNLTESASAASDSMNGAWIDIESLSRLRTVVGGRFENIKKKWIGAGFPLREHRGDKAGAFTLNQGGWVELSNWMSKHGFEARLCPDKPECLFQIRQVADSK